jgi:hypothetical protein
VGNAAPSVSRSRPSLSAIFERRRSFPVAIHGAAREVGRRVQCHFLIRRPVKRR